MTAPRKVPPCHERACPIGGLRQDTRFVFWVFSAGGWCPIRPPSFPLTMAAINLVSEAVKWCLTVNNLGPV
jgi:hypothetical protein